MKLSLTFQNSIAPMMRTTVRTMMRTKQVRNRLARKVHLIKLKLLSFDFRFSFREIGSVVQMVRQRYSDFFLFLKPDVRTRGSNAWLQSARISFHSQGVVDLSSHACRKRQLRTLLLSPTPSEAMDSVINDRRSTKWPCYAVNSSRNGLHSHSKRDLWH